MNKSFYSTCLLIVHVYGDISLFQIEKEGLPTADVISRDGKYVCIKGSSQNLLPHIGENSHVPLSCQIRVLYFQL